MGFAGVLEHLPVSLVCIILVNWNGWRDTLECLASLHKIPGKQHRIVVCDNGSTDDSVQQIAAWAQKLGIACKQYDRAGAEKGKERSINLWLTVIRSDENLGFAGGNNLGLRYGLAQDRFDYFWLLNNDTVVQPDSLTYLVERMRQDPAIGICGSTILNYTKREKILALGGGRYLPWLGVPWHHGRFYRYAPDIDRDRAEKRMNYVEGASMLVSRRFLEQVGLMYEEYFLYFEELDWALRSKGRFRLGYAPASIVYHKVGASIGTSSNPVKKSLVCDYYNIRNRIRFTRQHYPLALLTVYLVLLLEALIRMLCGRPDRAAMIIRLMQRRGADLEQKP